MSIKLNVKEQLSNGFLKVFKLVFDQKTFSGSVLKGVQREVLYRPNPVVFLMVHDKKNQKVLLVKQVRASAIVDSKPSPFVFEPIAGIIDEGETPLQAAIRECKEETGVVVQEKDLVFVGESYNSPGITNEHAYFYTVNIDSNSISLGYFGEGSENEDIETLLLTYEELDNLIKNKHSISTQLLLLKQHI